MGNNPSYLHGISRVNPLINAKLFTPTTVGHGHVHVEAPRGHPDFVTARARSRNCSQFVVIFNGTRWPAGKNQGPWPNL